MRRRYVVLSGMLLAAAAVAFFAWRTGASEPSATTTPRRSNDSEVTPPVLEGAAQDGESPKGAERLPLLEFPELDEDEGWIVGRVSAPDGTPCAEARVDWLVERPDRPRDDSIAGATTDGAGRFVVTGAAPAPYGAMVIHASWQGLFVRVPLKSYAPGATTDVGDLRLRGDLLPIAGRVVNDEDIPWEAEVSIVRERDQTAERGWDRELGDGDPTVFETSEDGRFRFQRLPPGRYRLTARADARATVLDHVLAGTTDAVLRIPEREEPPAQVVRLRLRIAGEAGAPPRERTEGLITMDAEGDLALVEREEGKDLWVVRLEGRPPFDLCVHDRTTPRGGARWRPVWLRGLLPRAEPYEVTLEPGHTLRGRVFHEGKPTRVPLTLGYSGSGGTAPTSLQIGDVVLHAACADGEGNFVFPALPPGEALLVVGESTWRGSGCAIEAPPDAQEETPRGPWRHVVRMDSAESIQINLAPPGSRSVELTLPAGASKRAYPPRVLIPSRPAQRSGHGDLLASVEESADDRVRVTISGLFAHDPVDALVVLPGVGWSLLSALLPGPEPLHARLEPFGLVRGRVVDSAGRAVPDAPVRAWFDDVRFRFSRRAAEKTDTDAEGRFELRLPGAGPYDVLAGDLGEHSARSGSVRVQPGGPPLELRLVEPAVATGRIVGIDPRRGDEYYVFVAVTGAEHAGFPVAESDGFFEVSWPSTHSATLIARNHSDPTDRRVALLEVPKTGGTDLKLVLKPGFAVTGRVVDTAGRPASGATVTIRGRWTEDETMTSLDGRFTCLPQPDEALELHVRAADGREVRRAVKPGEIEIVLPAR